MLRMAAGDPGAAGAAETAVGPGEPLDARNASSFVDASFTSELDGYCLISQLRKRSASFSSAGSPNRLYAAAARLPAWSSALSLYPLTGYRRTSASYGFS